MSSIQKLGEWEFADLFQSLLAEINEDPINNFIRDSGFCDFEPTPAQTVALKSVFGQKLDDHTEHEVWQERTSEENPFHLEKELFTEVEIFKLMTGQGYDPAKQTLRNKIDLIIGRRGGKCQDWDSLITLADGSRVKIGDLVGKDFEILAYDEKTGKRIKSRGRGIDNGTKPVFRIKTRSGFELDRTGNHPLMTQSGWKTVEEGLLPGDMLQAPRVNDQFSSSAILDDEELIFLAYMIGDGCTSGSNLSYTQIPNSNSEEFCRIVTEYFGGRYRTTRRGDSRAVSFHPSKSPEIRELIRAHGLDNKTSHYKAVPDVVFKSPKRQIALFLNRLFSTDGSLYWKSKDRLCFEYCSTSKELASGIKHLLARFGIVSFLREKWVKYKGGRNRCYCVTFSDYDSVKQLIDEIGILGKDHIFRKKSISTKTTNHPDSLMPKEFWDVVTDAQQLKGYTNAEVVYGPGTTAVRGEHERLRKQYKPNREKLLKYYDNLGVTGLEKTVAEDYWFDEIVSIEYLGERKTAGIEVDVHHTYINDVVEHNTTISAMLALYCAIKTNWRPYLKKTPVATVAVLSHSRELSEEILEIIKSLVEESEVLSRLMDKGRKNTQSTFHLKIPFIVPHKKTGKPTIQYSRVAIKVGAASKKTTRGKAICALLCDEIAYWNLAENSAERDEDIIRAVRPALLQFGSQGLLLKLSSPGIKQGVLYNEYQKRDELPDDYIVFKSPSWVWNTILPQEEFAKEYQLDPVGFACEFRADFVDSISNFILPEFVEACRIKGASFLPPEDRLANVTFRAAIDAAFKGDRFTFSVVGAKESRMSQYIMKAWDGSRDNPVKAHDVAKYIKKICKQYRISEVAADQYSFQPLREIFEEYGVTLVERTFTNSFKKQIYYNLKRLVHNQQIDLLDHENNISEIKQLQVEQTATGTIRIGHPTGGKDDCADATAVASYLCTESAGVGNVDEGQIASAEHNVVRDIVTGRTFTAPPPELLAQKYNNSGFVDNSFEYIRDPETGQYRRATDEDDEDEDDGGGNIIFA